MIRFRLNLHRKILLAFLALSMIPTAFLAIDSSHRLLSVEEQLRQNATQALDDQAAGALELRAKMVAEHLGDFLDSCVRDLLSLSLLPPDVELWRSFASHHRREIWQRDPRGEGELRFSLPLYKELAWIDPQGRELLRLLDGEPAQDLRDVSLPGNTSYLSEAYFDAAASLPQGDVYMTAVTGWHVSRQEQLAGATSLEEAFAGKSFEGVIRLVTALRDEGGNLKALVVLSLDHRHLMEFTQHILPTEEQFTLFPSYDSGNYAFMFDGDGWIITHPKYWDIRGLDAQGQPVAPLGQDSSAEALEMGPPFNLFHAGFIHENYPVVASRVIEGRSGVVDVTNVGGSEKIMAYAPVPYPEGVRGPSSIFGGITIGAELAQFHRSAEETSRSIRRQITKAVSEYWLLISIVALLVCVAAYLLSQSILGPILKLTAGTREMARGKSPDLIEAHSGDEVEELASSFNAMAQELDQRRRKLTSTLEALRRSRQSLMRERNFKVAVLENVETGILTLDAQDRVTSANGPVRQILNLEPPQGLPGITDYLADWPAVCQELEPGLAQQRDGRWNHYVEIDEGQVLTFRLALLPLSGGVQSGRLLIVEDLTDRAQMRRSIARMERLASLGRLSAGLAHEIRNPLTGVSLLLDELHDRLIGDPQDQGLIQRALAEIERLETLMGELLSFSSQSRGALVPGDLSQVLEEVLFLVQRQCEASDVSLEKSMDQGLPRILLDNGKLKQAFHNLLNNALQSMSAGGRLKVSLSASHPGVFLTIEDSGVGIPPERIALIFEPFFTTRGEGTGLGLAITHNIVSEHGGRIDVTSRVGQGSCFRLWFPEVTD